MEEIKERIAKRLARAGVASRREVERLIADGRVILNGRTLDTPAVLVGDEDRIEVDGKPVGEPDPPRLWRYHKPAGLVSTNADELGRQTIFEHLPRRLPRVVSVGRLDINSEGLLLLTNDGGLKRVLELPSTGWLRRYRVRAFGFVDPDALARLAQGIVVDGIRFGPIEAVVERKTGRNSWIDVSLAEGKNREVRRAMESIGLTVNRLIRTDYGPFQLGRLQPGEVQEVPGFEMRGAVRGLYEMRRAPSRGQRPSRGTEPD